MEHHHQEHITHTQVRHRLQQQQQQPLTQPLTDTYEDQSGSSAVALNIGGLRENREQMSSGSPSTSAAALSIGGLTSGSPGTSAAALSGGLTSGSSGSPAAASLRENSGGCGTSAAALCGCGCGSSGLGASAAAATAIYGTTTTTTAAIATMGPEYSSSNHSSVIVSPPNNNNNDNSSNNSHSSSSTSSHNNHSYKNHSSHINNHNSNHLHHHHIYHHHVLHHHSQAASNSQTPPPPPPPPAGAAAAAAMRCGGSNGSCGSCSVGGCSHPPPAGAAAAAAMRCGGSGSSGGCGSSGGSGSGSVGGSCSGSDSVGGCNGGSNGGCGHFCASCRVRVQVEVECVNTSGAAATGSSSSSSRPSGGGSGGLTGGRLRTLAFPRRHRHKATKSTAASTHTQTANNTQSNNSSKSNNSNSILKKKKSPWTLRLNCKLKSTKSEIVSSEDLGIVGCSGCVCPKLPRTQQQEVHTHAHTRPQAVHTHAHVAMRSDTMANHSAIGSDTAMANHLGASSLIDSPPPPMEDWDMAEGLEPPPGFGTLTNEQLNQLQLQQASSLSYNSMIDLQLLFQRSLRLGFTPTNPSTSPNTGTSSSLVSTGPVVGAGAMLSTGTMIRAGSMLRDDPMGSMGPVVNEETLMQHMGRVCTNNASSFVHTRTIHTQVDYIHCLVPDLLSITNCIFYWGKMDRYEAERLLDNKPEGTFLLRDSAQEEYLFSVSFRRYSRSLHARIEQWNHRFSFDSHDPGVYASNTVCGLIEHYKDPSCCMFFEPMLTRPLARTYPFPLQHLCRAAICTATTYDGLGSLRLPKRLSNYLKEYHYKQRVRVRRLDH